MIQPDPPIPEPPRFIFWVGVDPHGTGNANQFAERDLQWAKADREAQKGRD